MNILESVLLDVQNGIHYSIYNTDAMLSIWDGVDDSIDDDIWGYIGGVIWNSVHQSIRNPINEFVFNYIEELNKHTL